jgi:WD40 repeat protein
VTDVAISPDDQVVASRDRDGIVRLWWADTGQPLAEPVHGPWGSESGLTFSPDGHLLIVTTGRQTELLDVSDIRGPVNIWTSPASPDPGIADVAFSPDGMMYAAPDETGKTYLWSLAGLTDLRSHLLERACSIAARGLTADDWFRLVPGEAYQPTCTG